MNISIDENEEEQDVKRADLCISILNYDMIRPKYDIENLGVAAMDWSLSSDSIKNLYGDAQRETIHMSQPEMKDTILLILNMMHEKEMILTKHMKNIIDTLETNMNDMLGTMILLEYYTTSYADLQNEAKMKANGSQAWEISYIRKLSARISTALCSRLTGQKFLPEMKKGMLIRIEFGDYQGSVGFILQDTKFKEHSKDNNECICCGEYFCEHGCEYAGKYEVVKQHEMTCNFHNSGVKFDCPLKMVKIVRLLYVDNKQNFTAFVDGNLLKPLCISCGNGGSILFLCKTTNLYVCCPECQKNLSHRHRQVSTSICCFCKEFQIQPNTELKSGSRVTRVGSDKQHKKNNNGVVLHIKRCNGIVFKMSILLDDNTLIHMKI